MWRRGSIGKLLDDKWGPIEEVWRNQLRYSEIMPRQDCLLPCLPRERGLPRVTAREGVSSLLRETHAAQKVMEARVGVQATESILVGGDEALQLFKPVEHDVDLPRSSLLLACLDHQEPLAPAPCGGRSLLLPVESGRV